MAGQILVDPVPSATDYDSCLRKCVSCGIGASNAANRASVTYIYNDPLDSIPVESRRGAREVLARALNVRNRKSKFAKFGFSPTSEDAVSWVLFTYLLRCGRLAETLSEAGVIDFRLAGPPTLLLWGAPVDAGARGEEIREALERLCRSMGESPQSFSEPDVVIDFGEAGVVFIEVKLGSANETRPQKYPGWTRYRSIFPSVEIAEEVVQSGCYELARNWCLLRGLAASRKAVLVNLGRSALFQGDAGEALNRFSVAVSAVGQPEFMRVSWDRFLAPVRASAPLCVRRFLASRALPSS